MTMANRRWLSFGLRWLFVALLVVAAYCGGYVQGNGEVDELKKHQQELEERKSKLESAFSSLSARHAYCKAWFAKYETMLRQEGFDVTRVEIDGDVTRVEIDGLDIDGWEPGFKVHLPRSGRTWYVNPENPGALSLGFEEITEQYSK